MDNLKTLVHLLENKFHYTVENGTQTNTPTYMQDCEINFDKDEYYVLHKNNNNHNTRILLAYKKETDEYIADVQGVLQEESAYILYFVNKSAFENIPNAKEIKLEIEQFNGNEK